jgi:glucose/arabinose dehydrogenase
MLSILAHHGGVRRAVIDEGSSRGDRCPQVTAPTLEIQAHSAPLGLTFYTGRQFPAEYHGDVFVAYHGSWNRSVPTGYKVARIRFRDGKPAGVEDFATGWLRDGRVLGRPVDLIVGRDDALFLSDDSAGQIDRIIDRASP